MEKKSEKQTMSLQVTEGLTVTVLPDSNYEFLMPTKEVASGYNVDVKTIRFHLTKNPDDFIEGKHFLKGASISSPLSKNVQPHQVFYTKRGVVRLGFFIKSERARLFRDWAEDLIIDRMDRPAIENKRSTSEITKRLQEHYQQTPADKVTREVIEAAIVACGTQSRLAERIGVSDAVFSHIKTRPWLVSDEMLRGIERACRNILSRSANVDTETIEQLMLISDERIRMNLFTKMRKGGLI
jgi:hypothetical protein